MPIAHQDQQDVSIKVHLRRIILSGRLDIPGTEAIAAEFSALVSRENQRVIVDLTGVNFLSSFGIRALIANAKAMQKQGGHMVLLVAEDSSVMMTLKTTGIDSLIPILTNQTEAEKVVLA